jgi:NADH-quinone oxidoreductase subunit F
LDLHFTTATATEEERAAAEEILGAPDSGWRGGERDVRSRHQAEGGHAQREKRHLLLPALHAVQGRIGWISPGALNYLCERLVIPPAEAYGVASFYALFSLEKQPPTVVHVCDDIACKTRGADALCAALEERFGPAGAPGKDGLATWKRSPCLGLCEKAPAALCQVAGIGSKDYSLAGVDVEAVLAALQMPSHPRQPHTRGFAYPSPKRRGVNSDSLFLPFSHAVGEGPTSPPTPLRNGEGSIPFSSPSLCLLARVGVVDPRSLDDYRAKGGYQALRRALEIGPGEVIREVTEAKLTGRGGAAFPTGAKWKAVAEVPARPHYLVCNADESEPGTFKDRVLMEEDPFSVIEALTIAGFACSAEKGYIYIRGEYPEATSRLQNAIDRARERGLLGENILGRGVTFEIEIRRGAGAYICGEETALLESIEGKRGEPRNKPPFPVHVGLFGKPTAINNVETLVNVLPILTAGGQAYAATGTERSTGTRLFCLSGCVERPGVYEIPHGATLGALLELAGGVRGGRKLQAILLGGAAGVFVRPDELDIPLTLEGARTANATLGSGVIMAFDDTVDMKGILVRIAAFFRDESCGQCVPCRVGTVRQEEALHRLLSANGSAEKELALLAELEQVMKDASICGLGQTAASAIMSAIHRLGIFRSGAA